MGCLILISTTIWIECSPLAWETWVQFQVESYQRLKKWYLMPHCLTLSIIRYGSRVKWSNPGKGVAPSLTPWCSSYRKGSLWVTLDKRRQLYLLTLLHVYIYIYIYICVCACIYIYINICVCVCVHVYIYICVCVCVCIYKPYKPNE